MEVFVVDAGFWHRCRIASASFGTFWAGEVQWCVSDYRYSQNATGTNYAFLVERIS